MQHADDAVLAEFVAGRVVNAAKGQGLEPEELLPVHLSPPHTRRRAGLHGLRTARGAVLGYREGGSHRVRAGIRADDTKSEAVQTHREPVHRRSGDSR